MRRWLLAGTLLALLGITLVFLYPPGSTGATLPGPDQLLDGPQLDLFVGAQTASELIPALLRIIPPDVLVLLVLFVLGGVLVGVVTPSPANRGVPSLGPLSMNLTGTLVWLISAFLGGLLASSVISAWTPTAFWVHWGSGLLLQFTLMLSVLVFSYARSPGNPFGWLLTGRSLSRSVRRGSLEFLRYYPYLLVGLLLNEFLVIRLGTPGLPLSYRFIGAADSLPRTILIFLLIGGVAPVVEELFFRGIFYGGLRSYLPVLPSCLLGGGFFGLIHFEYQTVLPLWIFGTILCYVYERSGSIKVVITMHFLQNTISLYAVKRLLG